ncbi:MAG: phenylalanine--tRNA ligase subunit beta [Chloroflexi bacterium]|nr:phenylalanine--tRNA ligase subunit beta [Chloroflexota bacterium]
MRVPLKWLRDYVDVTLPPDELAHRLTMAGLEVEEVIQVGADWHDVYVGQVLELKPHPNADRLQLVSADYGLGTITVVTGAFNLQVGDKVPVALVGARLIDGHSDEPKLITLKPSKLRGIVSEGMVCSAKELGLGEEHTGILILPPDARMGAPLREELGEAIFDISVTPNRSDALSLLGVGREVAALTAQWLRYPPLEVPTAGPDVHELARVDVLDPDLCPRYSAMVIRGVKMGPSPRWLQERLTAAGVRPISNVVDVTNYVMLEMGQPLHAFDLRLVADHHIIVRRAHPGETLVTLDGVERQLEPDMLLIADVERGIGLAGVMGGANTEIRDDTRDILLEAATFNPINNRRTARALALPTEASRRFEKGLPPELTVPALERSMRLMHELAGGEVAPGIIDVYPNPLPERQVLLPAGEVQRLLGYDPGKERVIRILEALEFAVQPQDGDLLVTVPPYRVDVTQPADLVEEVARIDGYEHIPDRLLPSGLPPQQINLQRHWEAVARQALVGSGLAECIFYSLTSRQRLARLLPPGQDKPEVLVQAGNGDAYRPLAEPLPAIVDPALVSGAVEPLQLVNPLASESDTLRTTAMGTMLETLRANLRHQDQDVDLFEIGRIFLPRPDDLPEERRVATIALGGYRSGRALGQRVATDFLDLKGVVGALLARFGLGDVSYVPVVHPIFHPARAALVVLGQPNADPAWPRAADVLGILGEVNREVAENFDITGQRVYLAALDLARTMAMAESDRIYQPLLKYPPVNQDIAVVVDEGLANAGVERQIRLAGGELLRGIRLFDLYAGKPIPEGKKSLAYSLTYQSSDHTLTDEEVRTVHKRIEESLVRELGARIRGEGSQG